MKTYQLTKISDLLAVPIERREDCVKCILTMLELYDLAKGDAAKGLEIDGMIWTDDGIHEVDLLDPDGAVLISLKVTA